MIVNLSGIESKRRLCPQLDDGCPLWMWRGSVDVEAAPPELLQRLLREQELWVGGLRQPAVVQTLSQDAEVYRYVVRERGHGLGSRPPRDHLVLR